MSRKKIELERCPVCGGEMKIGNVAATIFVPERKYIGCSRCGLLYGFQAYGGSHFETEEEAARVWNNGQAFKYRKLWDRLRENLKTLRKGTHFSGLTKQGIFDNLIEYMDFVEEDAFRGAAEDGE